MAVAGPPAAVAAKGNIAAAKVPHPASSSGEHTEKPPLSPGTVAQWRNIDPQNFDPDFAKQLIGMYERHVEGLPAPEIVPSSEPAGSSGEAASSSLPEPATD